MNLDKVNKLQRMGLGPVWVRRHVVAAGIAASTGSGAASDQALDTGSAIGADAVAARASNDQQDTALAAMDWDVLEASIRECTRCGLCEGRQHAVPGVGDRAARWLFVGEGPGRNED